MRCASCSRERHHARDARARPRDPRRRALLHAPNRAWAELRGWSGPPELLARIAQAAIDVVAELDGSVPACTITVTIPVAFEGRQDTDVERFTSPQDFVDHVTASALRHFTAIKVIVVGEDARADVWLIRERGLRLRRIVDFVRRERPAEGVFVFVHAISPERVDIRRALDRIVAAVARGAALGATPACRLA